MDMHLNLKSFKGPIVYYVRKEVRGGGGGGGVGGGYNFLRGLILWGQF